MKAITLCVNRFDEETKLGFLDLYAKVDAKVEVVDPPEMVKAHVSDDIPF
jgi:hypothetical protein